MESGAAARAQAFDAHREYLEGVAYRMIGSVAEAEDLVQDAYLRWEEASPKNVDDVRAYLTTIVTRLSIDHLRSARVKREEYVGPWLPEPVAGTADPSRSAELADSLSVAFLVVLEALNPIERAVFLLREVFAYDYDQIAAIVGKSEVNCRKIASRARSRVADGHPRSRASGKKEELLVERFLQAVDGEDMEALLGILTEDAVLYSDSGGRVPAARRPIEGAGHIARFMTGIRSKAPTGLSVELRNVNGAPGMVAFIDEAVQSAWSFDIADGRIRGIYVVLNPQKLARLHRSI